MHGVDMHNWTPIDFVKYIDKKYMEAKKDRISRLSVQWGQWAREMNIVLRSKTEVPDHHDEMPTRFKYVFAYWILRSQLLELYHSYRFTKKRKIKSTTEQCEKVRNIILSDEVPRRIQSIRKMAEETIGRQFDVQDS